MMHPDEIPSDETLVAQLVRDQAPQWSALPVQRFASTGTDNALYRLGEELVVRLPRRPSAADLLAKEIRWLPYFSDLPLATPELRFAGQASETFSCDFAVFSWLEGDAALPDAINDAGQAASGLAKFLKALHEKSAKNAPLAGNSNHQRGVVLDLLSETTRASIDVLADEIDAAAAHALWNEASADPFQGPAVWLHGDLKADNLLAKEGRLCAVIDWGLCAVGDPAADYAAAWSWIEPGSRWIFREVAGITDADWLRAKGWALFGAVIALSYYRGGKNEALSEQSRQTLERLGLR